jgi:phosphatidylserine/phosphatidylglycerophosphate/cardiolipin synthase-like enzyme
MRFHHTILCLAMAAVSPAALAAQQSQPTQQITASLQVYFSPRGGCTDAVVRAIDSAKNTICVQSYSFTNKYIAIALSRAHSRGVSVSVILDHSQRSEKYTYADYFAHSGIPTFIDDRHSIAGNKVIIIDSSTVITGSFDFTMQAETSNAENLLIIQSQELAAVYLTNWTSHKAHSPRYAGR